MPTLRDFDTDCFLCRIMRSFAITGLGAGVAGFGALQLGVPQSDAVYWAFAGGIVLLGVVERWRAQRKAAAASSRGRE